MAESCRFAFAVHILAVLAHQRGHGVTSDMLAGSVNTNPVVVRRILSSLRRAGLVCCAKGCGGGATLCRDPETIALDEIYRAIEPQRSLAGKRHHPNLRCPVGRQIKRVLEEVYSSAQCALEASLAERTLADALENIGDAPPAPRKAPRSSRKAA
ncbi:MAG: Rrf2 family transcriptional regulator [Chthoniobacteraceae bacterium]